MQQIKIGMVVDTFCLVINTILTLAINITITITITITFYRYEIIGVVIFGFSLKSEVITVTFQHDQLKSGKKNLLD